MSEVIEKKKLNHSVCDFCNKTGGDNFLIFDDIPEDDQFTVHMKCLNTMFRRLVVLTMTEEISELIN